MDFRADCVSCDLLRVPTFMPSCPCTPSLPWHHLTDIHRCKCKGGIYPPSIRDEASERSHGRNDQPLLVVYRCHDLEKKNRMILPIYTHLIPTFVRENPEKKPLPHSHRVFNRVGLPVRSHGRAVSSWLCDVRAAPCKKSQTKK